VRSWQLQAAKARLSEVLRAAEEDGPQEITLRGRSAAVVLSRAEFDRRSSRKGSFAGFLRRSPLAGMELGRGRGRGPRRGEQ